MISNEGLGKSKSQSKCQSQGEESVNFMVFLQIVLRFEGSIVLKIYCIQVNKH